VTNKGFAICMDGINNAFISVLLQYFIVAASKESLTHTHTRPLTHDLFGERAEQQQQRKKLLRS